MAIDQFWTCLPAVLTSYDGIKGNVRPLVKMQFTDGSYKDLPIVEEVRIITPATAFSGIKLPVRVGDKVVLHICDRDIQQLIRSVKTAGLEETASVKTPTKREHHLTDAIAYTGFSSLDEESAKTSDEDIWIFNNDDSDSYNHVRIKGNGGIEIKTRKATTTLNKDGDITLENSTAQVNITDSGDITLENSSVTASFLESGDITLENSSVTASFLESGEVTVDNGIGSITLDTIGNISMVSPVIITLDAPLVNCTGELAAYNNSIHMSTHFHGGVLSGPAVTSPPSNPS